MSDSHRNAVRALKQRLINYTVLQVPDPSKPYVLRTDASGDAVGAVLEQDGKPVGFLSQSLTPVERRYSVYDQELLALVRALSKWRQLLLAAEVVAYTDHRALQYLLQLKIDKPPRDRVARWLDFLADFQKLVVEYKPGMDNLVADALSRCPIYSAEYLDQHPDGVATVLMQQRVEAKRVTVREFPRTPWWTRISPHSTSSNLATLCTTAPVNRAAVTTAGRVQDREGIAPVISPRVGDAAGGEAEATSHLAYCLGR